MADTRAALVELAAEMDVAYRHLQQLAMSPDLSAAQAAYLGVPGRTVKEWRLRIEAAISALLASEGASSGYPIPLNEAQQRAVKDWAADDRLWTTQETVAINLTTFARKILSVAGGDPPPSIPPATEGDE